MSEEKKQPEADAARNDELLNKIKVLEEALDSIEQSRKKRSMISLIGLVLVLLGLILFFINLKSFAAVKLNDADFQKELLTIVRNDLKDMAKSNPNITLMQQDFKEKVLPYVSKQILERFKKDVPKFQEVGENFADELKAYLNNDVKDKLIKALSESLVEVETILKEKYPTMKADELHKIINEARHIFVIRITDIIEKKLDYISEDLGSLKTSIENFKNCEEYKTHDAKNPNTSHHVKIQIIESMLELVIYQLNDEKGQRPVEPLTAGGAK
jgi:hypothetical protein